MIVVNCDSYVSEVDGDVATIEFRSGEGRAGSFVARDAEGNELPHNSIGATFNLKEPPWHERLEELRAP